MSRGNHRKISNFKRLVITSSIALIIAILVFVITYVSYSNKLKQNMQDSLLRADDLADIIAGQENLLEEANMQIGKSIEESKNAESLNTPRVEQQVEVEVVSTPAPTPVPTEEPVPEFIIPVEGEVMREYAKDNLLYSQTLDEWVTHLGLDIKADKTAVVKASSSGVVTAIKNDPRYGLTVVIEHTKGFKTVYSNLLTAEFVTLGEVVETGQTIGTVGNTATFEILDEYHLHFEILENNENVDPSIYIK